LSPEPSVALSTTPTALSVAITTGTGETFRWGSDEPNATNVPLGVSFSSCMPGGFKSATITLPRRVDL
jgi:hypothetical protein